MYTPKPADDVVELLGDEIVLDVRVLVLEDERLELVVVVTGKVLVLTAELADVLVGVGVAGVELSAPDFLLPLVAPTPPPTAAPTAMHSVTAMTIINARLDRQPQ